MFQSVSKCFPLFPKSSVWSMFSQNVVCEFELSYQCSLLTIQRIRCRSHFFTVPRVFIIFFIVRTSKPYIDVDHTYHVWIRPLNYMFMLIFVNIFVNFFSSEYWIYSLFLYIFLSESAFSVTILPKYLKPSFYFIICPWMIIHWYK